MKNYNYKNANLILILPLLFMFITELYAQPTLTWAKQFGGTGQERGHSVAVDSNGNVYTIGNFGGTTDFDPGSGVFNLNAANGAVFVSKLNTNGNFIWAKQLGNGTTSIQGYSLALDNNGNVYTTGTYRGTGDFDPGVGIFNLTSAGNGDIFISKLDVNGNFVWAKSMGGVNTHASQHDRGWCITVDNNGYVYTTGDFDGTGDFDPGSGVHNLTAAGATDIFVSKLDLNGNFIWAKQIGGGSSSVANDYGRSVVVDANGNVHITGWFNYTVDFDPGPGVHNLISFNGGAPDIFVLKLDANGNFIWVKQMGGVSSDYGESIAIDAAGNIYTTGRFMLQGTNPADFDPGPGVYNLTSAGSHDIFISKLDANGNFVWARSMGSTGNDYADYGRSIAIDAVGNVYTSGRFQNTVDFDPGAGIYNLTSAGDDDVFISKLDANGNFLCAARMGGIGRDRAYSLAIDGNENCYVTGFFADTADFDPGAGTYNLTTVGGFDVFAVKLDMSVCTNTLIASFIPSTTTLCEGDSITFTDNSAGTITSWNWTFNGGVPATANTQGPHTVTFNSPGTFNIILQVSDGVDTDDTTIVITVHPTSSSTQNQSICQGDSIFLGGAFQTSAGTYIDTLFSGSSNGCDSIITTNLTITPLTTGVDIQQACDSFTWIDNVTYTSSTNTPSFIITGGAANGCDSVVILDLTINSSVTNNITTNICQGDSVFVGGTWQTTSGVYYDTLNTTTNCDSVLATTLVVNSYFFDTLTMDLCQGDSIYVGGNYQTTSGTYTDTITNQNSCDSIIQSIVMVIPRPLADFEVQNITLNCQGTQVQLLNNSTQENNYLWSFGDEQTSTAEDPTHVFATSGSYDITLTVDSNICSNSHTHTLSIAELELIIPNVVTPNNDGKNDFFTLPLATELKECSSYKIYNRWGQLLYESKNTEKWDTRTKSGKLVPKGTYFYIVEIGATIYKGTFTIL